MKNFLRPTAVFVLLLGLLMGGYGCMFGLNNNTNDALAYMGERYGGTFTYSGPHGSSYMTSGMKQILVNSDTLPEDEILVQIYDDGSYLDNYMDYYYRQQMSEYLTEEASLYFGDVELTIDIPYAPSASGVTQDTGFDEYLVNENRLTSSTINIASTDEEKVAEFVEHIRSQLAYFLLKINVTDTGETYLISYNRLSEDVSITRRDSD